MFDDSSILITGGTGSFGKQWVNTILQRYRPRRIIVFSRDELKQYEMSQVLNTPCVRYFIGDVRDQERLLQAMGDVDFVFFRCNTNLNEQLFRMAAIFTKLTMRLLLCAILCQSVPIYLKEHYSQFAMKLADYRGKSPYIYKVLKSLLNVYLLNHVLPSERFIRESIFTASQTGTACFEAACLGKKNQYYLIIHGFQTAPTFTRLMRWGVFGNSWKNPYTPAKR